MDVHEWMAVPREALGAGTTVGVRVGGDLDALAADMAEEMAHWIRDSARTGRPRCIIVPVGPVGQYPLLAEIIVREGLDCSRVTLVNMDEFLDDRGDWIDEAHPLSFRGYMRRALYDLLPADLAFRPENRIFPDPADCGAVQRAIEERGGVDVCFGGIGLNGHLAFNEPEPDAGVEEFAARPTRVLAVAQASRAHMAINLSCSLELIPDRAVTVGMREILGARRLSFYANRPWQRGVVRQLLHGPVTPGFPASYLQRHPDARLTLTDFVAEAQPVRLQ